MGRGAPQEVPEQQQKGREWEGWCVEFIRKIIYIETFRGGSPTQTEVAYFWCRGSASAKECPTFDLYPATEVADTQTSLLPRARLFQPHSTWILSARTRGSLLTGPPSSRFMGEFHSSVYFLPVRGAPFFGGRRRERARFPSGRIGLQERCLLVSSLLGDNHGRSHQILMETLSAPLSST